MVRSTLLAWSREGHHCICRQFRTSPWNCAGMFAIPTSPWNCAGMFIVRTSSGNCAGLFVIWTSSWNCAEVVLFGILLKIAQEKERMLRTIPNAASSALAFKKRLNRPEYYQGEKTAARDIQKDDQKCKQLKLSNMFFFFVLSYFGEMKKQQRIEKVYLRSWKNDTSSIKRNNTSENEPHFSWRHHAFEPSVSSHNDEPDFGHVRGPPSKPCNERKTIGIDLNSEILNYNQKTVTCNIPNLSSFSKFKNGFRPN